MSSLLDKLMALVNANVRGPRRYRRDPTRPTQARETPSSRQQETDTAATEDVSNHTDSPLVASQLPHVGRLAQEQDKTVTLEEERVADLLKRKKT
jgi:hypothetical protein